MELLDGEITDIQSPKKIQRGSQVAQDKEDMDNRYSHLHFLPPPSSPISDSKRRSVTLARNGASPLASRQKYEVPYEFTRVRRMNTFKCVVKRPVHRPLTGKALSLNDDYRTQDNSFIQELISKKQKIDRLNLDKVELTEEDTSHEVQEFTIEIATPLSSISTSSDISSQEDTSSLLTPTIITPTPSPFHSTSCPMCNEETSSHDTLVVYGNSTLHLRCFKCGRCKTAMGAVNQFLVQLDGSPLCLGCSPSCHSCCEKIVQNHVCILKKDFHEQCLACYRCKRKFNLLTKIYASEGEPCCASCITPVFSETWSPTKLSRSSFPSVQAVLPPSVNSRTTGTSNVISLSPSPSTDSGVSETASNDNSDPINEVHSSSATPSKTASSHISPNLNPRLESLTRSITAYSNSPHRSMRSSVSAPNLNDSNVTNLRTSLSSLRGILFDENGSLLFLNYCINQSAVELVAFWLDVEHFKHFDGGSEDMKLFAHHIVLKYIGCFAELPIPVSREIQTRIFERMEMSPGQNIFDEAQEYVYCEMERNLLQGFLHSDDGKNYLEILVDKELLRMKKKTPPSSLENLSNQPLRACVTNFDKRHMETKYYVYEVEIQRGETKYFIYRRYSEWYALNQSLHKAFRKDVFPPLPKKIFLRRSQIRAVAEQRMKELQLYLQGLLCMSPEILNCKLLCQFLAQTEMDKEDELFNKRVSELQRRKSHE